MHYENQGSYFVLPAEPNKNFDVSGETKRIFFSSLLQRNKTQNQVFDRGKRFEEVSVARGYFV